MNSRIALLAAAASLAVAGCTTAQTGPVEACCAAPAAADEANAELAQLFAEYDAAMLELSPQSKSYRGIIDEDYSTLGDPSLENDLAQLRLMQSTANAMKLQFDRATLNEQDRISYDLFLRDLAMEERLQPFHRYGFIFNQMFGQQSGIPAFLINIHRVSEVDHAVAYVERIADIGRYMDELTQESAARANDGIMPPDWVYPFVLNDIDNLLAAGTENAVLEDFAGKIAALDISDEAKAGLMDGAETAWTLSAIPAYQRLRAEMVRQQAMAPTDDGVWRLPSGADYYAAQLSNYTNSDMTPDEVHNIGLREVERIHGLMRGIMAEVGFEGSLSDFFEFTRTDPQFFAQSREEYLAKVDAVYEKINPVLPQYFGILPEDDLVVKPVEAFREKSAGKAFYQSPAPDGSRPGTYYVNLYELDAMSLNELEALAYHEGNPGHHLQRSIQTGLDGLPNFRRFGGQTAYTEGWGLYSEELGKDMGFYTDPYSDFGRLGMELWRAARLVVDTGLHHKRWSREQAIDYLLTNTPNPEADARKAIERYAILPGQATAYMIGKLKIMELRQRAMDELGDQFSWAEFHDRVLAPGPVPLDMLEANIDTYIAAKKRLDDAMVGE
ncbi:DUF885 domain-containing protein [Sphingomicrobium sediminis]|uniref:DUF885 domain-containing protein n=1 Tax=Sphingomicrobium sediminis TaxID=2950949 RepID=A0A9X2EI42_9SPHN|nr:DUF885 domain-containing protein [Sphingomicrobium sediminis]MCM8557916.1 DUF885 domain-containing protein [Sphingomicrobium sediminis]